MTPWKQCERDMRGVVWVSVEDAVWDAVWIYVWDAVWYSVIDSGVGSVRDFIYRDMKDI